MRRMFLGGVSGRERTGRLSSPSCPAGGCRGGRARHAKSRLRLRRQHRRLGQAEQHARPPPAIVRSPVDACARSKSASKLAAPGRERGRASGADACAAARASAGAGAAAKGSAGASREGSGRAIPRGGAQVRVRDDRGRKHECAGAQHKPMPEYGGENRQDSPVGGGRPPDSTRPPSPAHCAEKIAAAAGGNMPP